MTAKRDWRLADGWGEGAPAPAMKGAAERPNRDFNWAPPDFPDLSGEGEAEANFETDGLDWRGANMPIAMAVHCGGRSWYLPWGHRGGGNLPGGLDAFRRWATSGAGLKGKRIANPNVKFDAHMGQKIGVDFEELGCRLTDPQHWAGLLDDHRKRFNVDALIEELLGERPMPRLDESRMAEYHAGQAAPRAEYGVRKSRDLWAWAEPRLREEGLLEVLALEEDVIPAVVEMERNGAPIDMGLAEKWKAEVAAEILALRREISGDIGLAVQETLFDGGRDPGFVNPKSRGEMEALFRRLGLEAPVDADTGKSTFNAEALSWVHHPTIDKVKRQAKLLDLDSKYLTPYLANVDGSGTLRYELHQMRGDENGTVRGRFAAARVNIQQVLKPSKQAESYGPGRVIRRLFLPGAGHFASADAAQIEYRIFASYAKNPAVLAAYKESPWLNFHSLTQEMLQKHAPGISYDKIKTLNFLTIYGGGLAKLALQLGFITGRQFSELGREFGDRSEYPYGVPRDHPSLAKALAVKKAYEKALPEAGPLSRRARDLAAERGWVRDVLGRRARFPGGFGAHAALNAVIQPSAAEVMKRKMVEVHRARRRIGVTPRMTIHDDWLGDCRDSESAGLLYAVLNAQSFPQFRVPILWEVKLGARWSECAKLEDQFKGMGADGTWHGARGIRGSIIGAA